MGAEMRLVMTCLAGLVAACSAGPQTGDTGGGQTRESGQTYKVYYLGGQSNMDGYGHVSELSEDQTGPVANAYIYTGNGAWDGEAGGSVGYWAPLTPGHGTGFATDGETNALSDRFGPELSFGRALAANSDQPIALIKYSRGGTSLADGAGYSDWFPEAGGADDLNQYDFALATIRNAGWVSDARISATSHPPASASTDGEEAGQVAMTRLANPTRTSLDARASAASPMAGPKGVASPRTVARSADDADASA